MTDLAALDRFGPSVHSLCAAFDAGLYRILGSNLHSLTLYGAATFDETVQLTDIDFLALLIHPLTPDLSAAVHVLHADLATSHPPLGGELDGYYILVDDARKPQPPRDLLRPHLRDSSWALHCAHIRAGRRFLLRGQDPASVLPEPHWKDLETALQGELNYVVEHLTEYPAYGILNLCRLMVSYETRDVVHSKAGAAIWASTHIGPWANTIDRALRSYAHLGTPDEQQIMIEETARFLAFAVDRIESSRQC